MVILRWLICSRTECSVYCVAMGPQWASEPGSDVSSFFRTKSLCNALRTLISVCLQHLRPDARLIIRSVPPRYHLEQGYLGAPHSIGTVPQVHRHVPSGRVLART